MLFNSLEFIPFLLITLCVYFLLVPRRLARARKAALLAASYVFYMSWYPPYGVLLATATLVTFLAGLAMQRRGEHARRMILAAALLIVFGLLGYYKYGEFLARSLAGMAGAVTARSPWTPWDLALPVGISFYTFQTASYVIDVYRRRQDACTSLLDYALYVSFFPQLVAGPIVRSGELLPQLRRMPDVEASSVEIGLARISLGLVKKVVLADSLAVFADTVFAAPTHFSALPILMAIYAYTYQIYFDFSGYSDIAIGLGHLFGLRLPENFQRPYLATSFREFWRRWHMTLSSWLRDYLYIPLGGNRGSVARTYANILVTMALGGLWHGANWTFVVWGVYHGVLLVLERVSTLAGLAWPARVPVVARRIVTFHLVAAGWVLFRSPDLGVAADVFAGLVSGWKQPLPNLTVIAVLLAISVVSHVLSSSERLRDRLTALPASVQGLGYGLAMVAVFLFSPATARFIYFQF